MNTRPDDPSRLTGSYALDAAEDSERAELDAAIASDDDARAEADSLRETALLLAYAVEPVEPPAALKASIMAKIAATPQQQTSSVTPVREAQPEPAPDAPSAAASVADAHVAHAHEAPGSAAATARARWFQRPVGVIVSAAAAAAIITGGTLGVNHLVEPAGPSTSVQASSKLSQIYAAADFQRSTTAVKGGGTATVVWSDDLGRSAVIFDGVKAAPSGKTYQLWYIGSTIKSAGLAGSVDGGATSVVLSGKKSAGDTVGITVEPAGGSKQPTTKPIAAVATSKA